MVQTTTFDLRIISRVLLCMGYIVPLTCAQIATFDAREATIASTHQGLYTGLNTCRQVVSSFLTRIEELNHVINAIITLDPDSLDTADRLDEQLKANNGSLGHLFCIPILLKDNFDTANMPTTGGNLGLAKSQPTVDAPSVTALKNAGAVVLGKTNLHELALEGLTVSSLGGQTINPYDLTRTPGGSSGGTGAAVAASFSVWGTGSDTINSLRSPASANSLISCRPTRGLIGRSGIIPNSFTQDAIGPIARCVEDVAVALTVMAATGLDLDDNSTALVPAGIRETDYSAHLASGTLMGKRLGLVKTFFNLTVSNETTPVNDAFAETMSKLKAAGATVVDIDDDAFDSVRILNTLDTQRYEYREGVDEYLQKQSSKGQHPSTLDEIFSSGKYVVIPSQYNFIATMLASSTSNQSSDGHQSYQEVQNGIEALKIKLQETFVGNKLDALIYPQQKNLVVKLGSPSQGGRNGILAAVTGSPVVAMPIGFSVATETAPEGIPIGMEFLGLPWTEEKLLQIAYQFQSIDRVRIPPRWAQQVLPAKHYSAVPTITPNRENIPLEYPVGRR